MILEEIIKIKPAERLLVISKKLTDDVVTMLDVPSKYVSETTISRYLFGWGYAYKKNKKMIYFDGHEREDAVRYRD